MEFGRPMVQTPGIVAKSKIRLVEETHLGDDPLDRHVCRAANEAAKDLFLGNDNPSMPPPPRDAAAKDTNESSPPVKPDVVNETTTDGLQNKLSLVDCSLYNEHHLPPARCLIQPDDLVVVFESFNDLNFVYAKPDAIFSNRNGHFHHNDFIGQPYGCKIRSRNNHGLGFLYLLRPTPELWARSLPHRTQIVHELDASMIVHYLNLSPNMFVCESGTGSGAMSHAILRSIAPKGKLHTYEFNKMRVQKAREEFRGHGLGHMVEVHHRDVCGKKTLFLEKGKNEGDNADTSKKSDEKATTNTDDATGESATVKDGETTENTVESNGNDDKDDNDKEDDEEDDGKGGFQLGQAVAHAIFLDLPEPWLAVPHAAYTLKPNGRVCSYSPCMEQTQRTVAAMRKHGFHSLRTVEARLKEYFVDEVEMEAPPTDLPVILTEESLTLEKERCATGGVLPSTVATSTKQVGDEEMKDSNDKVTATVAPVTVNKETNGKKRKGNKILCARPFNQMRGHSAFLTFATAGNALQPDPNK